MEDKEYKKWLQNYSEVDATGLQRYLLTWNQIREIINEEKRFFAEQIKKEFDWTKVKDDSGAFSPGEVQLKIDKMVSDKERSAKRNI